jgi:hypothetical protein
MLTKDEIDDHFESLSFRPPKTYGEMKAWYHFSKYDGKPVDILQVFYDMGISPKKVHYFLNKVQDGFTKKETLESLQYIGLHSYDIRAILSYFKK